MADGGFLNPELEKNLIGDIEGVEPNIIMYREYFPMKDAIEYTMYLKYNGEKRRVDFWVECEDIARLDKDGVEDFVKRAARAAIMKEIDSNG